MKPFLSLDPTGTGSQSGVTYLKDPESFSSALLAKGKTSCWNPGGASVVLDVRKKNRTKLWSPSRGRENRLGSCPALGCGQRETVSSCPFLRASVSCHKDHTWHLDV